MKFATKAIHAGNAPDPSTGAVMPPIYMTSTFAQDIPGESRMGYEYTRAGNPNFTILEAQIAALEDAQFGTAFSSGLGALTGLVSTLSQGDKVVAPSMDSTEALTASSFASFTVSASNFRALT